MDQLSHESLVDENYIIAIGACPERPKDLFDFFKNTPDLSISYVIIQSHPSEDSSLEDELHIRYPQLNTCKISNGMAIEPNCIYFIAEDQAVTISNNRFLVHENESLKKRSYKGSFFHSLAKEKGKDSIAVLLSGADGEALNDVEAIKKEGGMVIVQNADNIDEILSDKIVESIDFDFVLSPPLIHNQVSNFVKKRTLEHKYLRRLVDDEEELISEVIQLLKTGTSLDFTNYKRPTIIRRTLKRMLAKEVNNISDYIKILKDEQAEVDMLAHDFLISTTRFFRDKDAFEDLKNNVIPALINSGSVATDLRIWVAGCSTGEEAYSIAILLKEGILAFKKPVNVKIFATDINKEALTFASKGFYSENITDDVSSELLTKYFTKKDEGYKINEEIREMVSFSEHNILHQIPFKNIDFISCRNLLIYLNRTLQKELVATFLFSLKSSGFLFLGSGEANIIDNSFTKLMGKSEIFRKPGTSKNHQSALEKDSGSIHHNKKIVNPLIMKSSPESLPENFNEIIIDFHLEESGYSASVCVDETKTILMPFGEYEKFMRPKLFNNNLMELLPEEVAIAVANSIRKSSDLKKKIAVNHISCKLNNELKDISILVKPCVKKNGALHAFYIIYFKEEKNIIKKNDYSEIFDSKAHGREYVANLEEELAQTKAKLKTAHIALDKSQESIQNYTEELLSTNEELQNANEELQATNEEVTIINKEYQQTIKELEELNDDFNNYFKSTIQTQVYVDKDLRIKMFTPATAKQINVKDNDIGRPLTDLSNNLKEIDLIEEVQSVINNREINNRQVETKEGQWYVMKIMPYIRSNDNSSDGAIITFYDITDLKKSQEIIEKANKKLMKINEDHDTFIYSVSHDLKSPLNSMEGLISILNSSDDIEQIKAITVPLLKSIINLRETIDELSNITNIEKEIEEAGYLDVSELIEEVKWSIRDLLKKSHALLVIKLEVKEIKFSKKNLRSIIYNLLCNSIKYRSNNRQLKIEIKTEQKEDFNVLTVKDNGIGISEDKIGEVFSKFKRIHENNAGVEGSGIGLYLVNKLVSNAGGEIKVESHYGIGTTFKVYFPL